ncbi:MAG: VCBS repeat-containing protein [Planctomycetota bacterium]|nr:MAG: VCBS repeat-containing protein [Planctomycetota bacterium]
MLSREESLRRLLSCISHVSIIGPPYTIGTRRSTVRSCVKVCGLARTSINSRPKRADLRVELHRPGALLMQKSIISIAALAAASSVTLAHCDFSGFTSTSYVVETSSTRYHVVEVYAQFTQTTDRLLNLFNAEISLSGNPSAVFHQAELVGAIPKSFLPLPFLPPGDEWVYDTYITVGAYQGNLLNGTTPDPDFDDSTYTAANAISGTGGWYNLPPSNGFGDAGSDLKVCVGQFTIDDAHYANGTRVQFAGTIGYSRYGIATFAADTRSFAVPSGQLIAYYPDRLDNDAISDVLFHNPQSRQVAAWLMNGLTRKAGAVFSDEVPGDYVSQGIGDLNGDGSTDLVFRNASGQFFAWLTNGLSITQKGPISGALAANWQCVGIGDLSGDGRADLVLHNTTTGQVNAWYMDGLIKISGGTIGSAPSAQCLGIGDLNADGYQDLLWRSSLGFVSGWIMQEGVVFANSAIAGAPNAIASSWSAKALRDLNGDGKADVLWYNEQTGAVSGWLMDGAAKTAGGIIHPGVASAWKIDAVRDVDGDGRYDILWRHQSTGDMNGWIMNGLTKQSGGFIRTANTAWTMAD